MNHRAIAGALAFLAASAAVTAGGGDAQTMRDAKISLTEAIHAAEKHGNGKAVEAELESGGRPYYSVEVLADDGKSLTEYAINADTGQVEKTKNEPVEKLMKRFKPDDLHSSETTLISAIREAEQQTGGKVVDAETDSEDGALQYELKVAMADGRKHEVKVDGTTGKMASK